MLVSQKLQDQLIFTPRVVAIFDLSVTVSASLLSQSTVWTVPDRGSPLHFTRLSFEMSWVGTAAAYTSCLQTILDDIWQDRGQQLDAWQQLYALACVKFCFRRMWKIGTEAKVARWVDMEDCGLYSSPASEGSLDESYEDE
jgi:hypothetical protein